MPRPLAALTAAALLVACASHRPPPRRPLFPSTATWKTLVGDFVVPPLAADSRRLYVATRDGLVRALEPKTGEVAWKAEGLAGTLSAADGTLLVRGENGTLTSLQPRTGKVRWQAATPVGGTLPAVIDEDRALVAGRGGLCAVELASGRVLWTAAGVEVTAPPVRAGARLLTGESDGALRCRDRATGGVMWSLPTRRALLAPPLVDIVRRVAYLGTTDKGIEEVKLDSGKRGWRWTVGADIADPGLLLPNRILFAAYDAVIYALDRHRGAGSRAGNLAWRGNLPSRPLSGPTLVADYVVVACLENELLAYDPETGRLAGLLRTSGVIRTAPVLVPPVLAVGLSDRSVVGYPLSPQPPKPAPAAEPPGQTPAPPPPKPAPEVEPPQAGR